MPSTDILTAADIDEFRFLVKDLAMPDAYDVLRTVSGGTDEFGGTLPVTDAVVETGMCSLIAGGLQPSERVVADRLGWEVAYAVELPYDTLLTPEDRIRINGRPFEVGGVSKEGRWGLSAIAVVQELG
jgi:hypothetical protein